METKMLLSDYVQQLVKMLAVTGDMPVVVNGSDHAYVMTHDKTCIGGVKVHDGTLKLDDNICVVIG